MSNFNTQEGNVDENLSAPLLVKESQNAGTEQCKEKVERKEEYSKAGRKKNLDDMIINKRELVPKEFSSLEDLKSKYLNEKQKKKDLIQNVWEWETTAVLGKTQYTCVYLTKDSSYILAGTNQGQVIMFDAKEKNQVHCFCDDFVRKINSIDVSDDNQYMVFAAQNDIRGFYFSLKKEMVCIKNAHSEEILSILISKDNSHVITGSVDGSIKITNLIYKLEVHNFANIHNGPINSLVFTNDKSCFVSGSQDGSVKVFDFNARTEIYNFPAVHKANYIASMCLSQNEPKIFYTCILDDGSAVLVYNSGTIKTFDLSRKEQTSTLDLGYSCEMVTIPSNGAYIASVNGAEKDIKIFNLRTKREEKSFRVDLHYICLIVASRDGNFLALSDEKNTILFSLVENKETVRIIDPNPLICCTFAYHHKYLISGYTAGDVRITDMETGHFVSTFKANKESIRSMELSRDDKYLLLGFYESIKIYDLEAKILVHHLAVSGLVASVALSRDNRFIISSSGDFINIFDLHTKKEINKFQSPQGASVSILEISKDNKYVLIPQGSALSTGLSGPDEFDYISPEIPIGSPFGPGYDDFLTSPWHEDVKSQTRLLSFHHNMYITPHNWTVLHLIALFNPTAIAQIPEYAQFPVPFLTDSYGKTPLHYLLAQKNYDYSVINIMLKYILDFMEDKDRITPYEYHKICSSLSDCFLFIISKASPGLVNKYLDLCFPETSPEYDQTIPLFGVSEAKYTYSQFPTMSSEILEKLYQEGDNRVLFHTNMIQLDYDPRSEDMFITTHILSKLEQENVFKIPIIENLIDHLWDVTKSMMYATAITFSALMTLLSLYIASGEQSTPFEVIILLLTSLFITSEIIQWLTLGSEYFKDFWNWFDLAQLLLTFIFISSKLLNDSELIGEAWIVSVIVITGYLRWLSYLQLFTTTRILIQIILTVLSDMVGFITIIASILIGFSLIFLEFGRNQPYPQEYGYHFYGTFKLLFGNYDDTDYTLSQKILVSFLMCVLNVVLLNLLISIIGDSYGKVQEGRDFVDAKTRLGLIIEAMILMRKLSSKKTCKKGYLIYRLPGTSDEKDLENKEWEARINRIEKGLQKAAEEEQGSRRNEMNSLDEKVRKIKNEIKINIEQQSNQIVKSVEGQSNQIQQVKTNVEQQVYQVREEIRNIGEQVHQIRNEVKENIEQQVSQVMRSMGEQASQILEVKGNVEQQVSQVRDEMKNMGEQVSQMKQEMQGLKQLVNLVLENLGQISQTIKPTSSVA